MKQIFDDNYFTTGFNVNGKLKADLIKQVLKKKMFFSFWNVQVLPSHHSKAKLCCKIFSKCSMNEGERLQFLNDALL